MPFGGEIIGLGMNSQNWVYKMKMRKLYEGQWINSSNHVANPGAKILIFIIIHWKAVQKSNILIKENE